MKNSNHQQSSSSSSMNSEPSIGRNNDTTTAERVERTTLGRNNNNNNNSNNDHDNENDEDDDDDDNDSAIFPLDPIASENRAANDRNNNNVSSEDNIGGGGNEIVNKSSSTLSSSRFNLTSNNNGTRTLDASPPPQQQQRNNNVKEGRKHVRLGSVRMPPAMEQFLYNAVVIDNDDIDDDRNKNKNGSSTTTTTNNNNNNVSSDHSNTTSNYSSGRAVCEGDYSNSGRGSGRGNGSGTNLLDQVVLESSYDMTEERLRRLFSLFDVDHDGRVSYDELKRGLVYQTTGQQSHLMDDSDFMNLISYLDMDNSGDISFEEFSEGMRLIMLRSLLKSVNDRKDTMTTTATTTDTVLTEVIDYNPHRLERHVVETYDNTMQSIRNSSTTQGQQRPASMFVSSDLVQNMSIIDFFFAHREEWTKVKWINISGSGHYSADQTLKMCALKYKLHPLALEDALECNNQRPKADSYSHHYFFLVPLFFLEMEVLPDQESQRKSRRWTKWCNWNRRRYPSSTNNTKTMYSGHGMFDDDDDEYDDDDDEHASTPYSSGGSDGHEKIPQRIKKIGVQMTSVFITMPLGETVITFNNQSRKEGIKIKLDDHHVEPLPRCWSRVQHELKKRYSKLRQYDGQYLAYSLLDQAVDIILPIIKTLRKAIRMEQQRLEETQYSDLTYMHRLRDNMKRMTYKLKPFVRLLNHIIDDDTISPGPTVFLRDVLDNLENFCEDIRQLIIISESVDDEQEKFERRKMDSTLYVLTVISAVFLPAQFLTGVWGMNFENMPELDDQYGYLMFWVLSLFLMSSTLILLNCGRRRA